MRNSHTKLGESLAKDGISWTGQKGPYWSIYNWITSLWERFGKSTLYPHTGRGRS